MMDERAIKAAFWNVLKSDSAGSAVRAALGNGAASITTREEQSAASLPSSPFLVMQWGVGGGSRTGVLVFFPTWWVYDSHPNYRYRRIDSLISLIRAAYTEHAVSMCHVDFLPGREVIDQPLGGVPGKSLPFQIRTRG
jgi:hypothetical protein